MVLELMLLALMVVIHHLVQYLVMVVVWVVQRAKVMVELVDLVVVVMDGTHHQQAELETHPLHILQNKVLVEIMVQNLVQKVAVVAVQLELHPIKMVVQVYKFLLLDQKMMA